MTTIISEISVWRYGNLLAFAVVSISKGDHFFSKYMIPNNVETLAEVERMENGSTKLVAKTDLIAVVEGLHNSHLGAKHVRFLRTDRKAEGAKGLDFVQPKAWPRLRVALRYSNVPTVHAQGGFNNVVAYSDELVVPDYSVSGSGGWIVRRKDIAKYLDALPALQKE